MDNASVRISELVLGYVDDLAIGDTASIVLMDFISLEDTASELGLEFKRSKYTRWSDAQQRLAVALQRGNA